MVRYLWFSPLLIGALGCGGGQSSDAHNTAISNEQMDDWASKVPLIAPECSEVEQDDHIRWVVPSELGCDFSQFDAQPVWSDDEHRRPQDREVVKTVEAFDDPNALLVLLDGDTRKLPQNVRYLMLNAHSRADSAGLVGLSDLRLLSLSVAPGGNVDLGSLRELRTLSLGCTNNPCDRPLDLTSLERLPNLQQLRLHFPSGQVADLSGVAGAIGLKTLFIGGEVDEARSWLSEQVYGVPKLDLTPLRGHPTLETIRFRHLYTDGGSIDLAPLVGIATLRRLSFEQSALETIDLGPVAHMLQLQQLELVHFGGQPPLFPSSHRRPTASLDLAPLAGHPSLTTLRIVERKLSELDLTPLAHVPRLRKLTILAGPDTMDFTPLAWVPHLEDLTIVGTGGVTLWNGKYSDLP